MKVFILSAMVFFSSLYSEEKIAQANGIEICYETFGDKNDPAFLLIMGACGQGIAWESPFCEKLASHGFYVIRYDQRDSGRSTCIDYAMNPYDFSDMAEDAAGLLDALEIPNAHVFGLSMGGTIGEFLAVQHPEKVLSLGMMGSQFDFRPLNLARAGLPPEPDLLAGPKASYIQAVTEIYKQPGTTHEEKVEQQFQIWMLINGPDHPLNEASTRDLLRQFFARSVQIENLKNYRKVFSRSEDDVKNIHYKIRLPVIIFQGLLDPIVGADHAQAITDAIPGSECLLIESMGHFPNPYFYNLLIDGLVRNSRKI